MKEGFLPPQDTCIKKWDDLAHPVSNACCAERVRNLDKDGRFSENTEKRSLLHSPTPSEEMHTVDRTVLYH
jgi:hypothetical protein